MQLLDSLSPVSAVTATIVVFLTVVYFLIKNRDILPGPKGLPYLGLFLSLKVETGHLQLQDFGKQYGDLFSFSYCGNLIINLGSAKAMRELHVTKSDCFAERYERFNMLTFVMSEGVGMVNGEAWKVLRKYFSQCIKEYGLAVMKSDMDGIFYDSLALTMKELKKRNGAPFNAIDLLTVRCTHTMRKVFFGEDGVSDKKLQEMNAAYAISLEGMVGMNLLLIGPLGKFIFHTLPPLRRALKQHKVMSDLLKETSKAIESKMDVNYPTCIIEDYFKERNERRKKNDPSWKYFTDRALVSSLTQFVGDGIISVAFFIGSYLYALVEHPEEQAKIYQELIDVVGPSRQPTIEDRGKLPYTNAFMNEVMRTSDFFTLFPSMECTKETTVRGHRIPKGSITLLNIWQAHHDPEVYEDPGRFDPSRYLSVAGKPRAELPVLFGMGKRSCLGESLVTLQGFLYFTNIVKNFIVSEPPNLKTKSEPFYHTGNLELCIVPRKEK